MFLHVLMTSSRCSCCSVRANDEWTICPKVTMQPLKPSTVLYKSWSNCCYLNMNNVLDLYYFCSCFLGNGLLQKIVRWLNFIAVPYIILESRSDAIRIKVQECLTIKSFEKFFSQNIFGLLLETTYTITGEYGFSSSLLC